MPPRPFPYRLRVGIDVCHVSRIQRIVTPTPTSPNVLGNFLRRILTEPECRYFWDRFGPVAIHHTKLNAVTQYLAGRFAAKEAIRKACDHLHKDVRGLHRIMILPIKTGHHSQQSVPPQGLILDHNYEQKSEESLIDSTEESHRSIQDFDGQLCEVSISHDNDMATAVALVPCMQKSASGSHMGQGTVQDGTSLTVEDNLLAEIKRHTVELSRLIDRGYRLRETERTTITTEYSVSKRHSRE